ncbi:MAG: hypothetical protein M1836_000038 [Candelina mexicana]|nr:MAG: hypothetical protein M1836_000038 [Candelina mexicana]
MKASCLPWRLLAALRALFILYPLCAFATSPAINVALEASFPSAPFLLELLETAANENATSYFPLLDRIAEGYFLEHTTDKELYDAFLQVSQEDGHFTDPEAVSSFQFALSIHAAAPRIEAHFQYYDTSVVPSLVNAPMENECPVWVQFGGKQYCSPALDVPRGEVTGHLYVQPFDRVLGSKDAPASVIYVDITSPTFNQFHEVVSRTAREGKSSYRVRYRPSIHAKSRPLLVSGYGVELTLKRTDYIVIDDREAEKANKEGSEFKQEHAGLEDSAVADLKPLSASELSGLALKASGFVMNSEDPLDTLSKLSQDFPKHSTSILAHNVTPSFESEFKTNRKILLPAGQNAIWINGVQIDARQMDAFALLEHLRRERKFISGLRKLGLSGPEAVKLLSHPAVAASQGDDEPQRFDFRDTLEGGQVILWLNNLEKDKRYEGWPTNPQALLQRTYPGQLPTVRRDIHNLIIPVDFTKAEDVGLVVDEIQGFVKRGIAIRFGLIPVTGTSHAERQAMVIYHLHETYGLAAVLTYLEASLAVGQLTSFSNSNFESTIRERKLRKDQIAQSLESVLLADELRTKVVNAQKYAARLGIDATVPLIFINGVALPRTEGWLQIMSARVAKDLQAIQRAVFEGALGEATWFPSYYLAQAISRRNPLVIPEDEDSINVLDICEAVEGNSELYKKLPRWPTSETASKEDWAHLFVIADFDSADGFQLLVDAINFSKQQGCVELVALHNAGNEAGNPRISTYLFQQLETSPIQEHAIVENLNKPPYSDVEASEVADGPEEARGRAFWDTAQNLIQSLGLSPGKSGLVLNGRLVGEIPRSTRFLEEDFTLLLQYERSKRLKPSYAATAALSLEDKIKTPLAAAKLSSLVARSMLSEIPEGFYGATSTARVSVFEQWKDQHTAISAGNADDASIQIVASIDPATEITQRWIPILKVLSEMSGIHLRIFLNPRERLQELPVKRFYRHVLESKPSFNEDGSLKSLGAHFVGIPEETLLTMAMDVPPAWFVTAKYCIHDLDNIKISSMRDRFQGSDIEAIYELENILIEGHSRDITAGPPPRGAQLVLGTDKDPHFADTIIMANLGYFQFKANPGYWKLGLQPGRSKQIFNIDSAGTKGYLPQSGDESTEIALMSFQGKTLFPRLSRKRGQEAEEVLEPASKPNTALDFVSQGLTFAGGFLNKVGLAKPAPKHADINIFSVASGHLYERMLNIMMLSVMKHTSHTVKFWFIEQFLSPSFKSTLPHLASHYNFQYQLVTFKWPHWLRAQKEKQREIWGYKILFLDVLFPLDLDKVIFVDADQIVRTDMYDLVLFPLDNAPYGFTPMCDSRTSMEGFRFWKQGYWASFLRGLPYHISALYVVDLKRFRQLAAGDRLRQQYQVLSADPNSLSNLDQDLPNHMQSQLRIKSLPMEWLWCETWCADEELQRARTIDLCNNPLTKEPKLDRARRQVPEWTVYDEEIAGVIRGWKEGQGQGKEDKGDEGGEVGDGDGGGNTKSRRFEEADVTSRKDEL